ncbi:MAG: class I SAM-dependent methyltransferase [Bacteroidetes bacterium]|nr:class I SAM-dependent methyltransferase [Bacteroidota bacterium]
MNNLNNINYERAEDLKRLEFIQTNLNKLGDRTLRVLDVGCGNGNISRYIGSKGHDVLGIDISEATINKAISLTQMPNVRFKNIAAEELIAAAEIFDLVICSEVIEHLDAPSTVVKALSGLINKNGILIVTVPNGFGPRELFITKPLQWMKSKTPFIYKAVNSFKRALGFSGATVQSDAENLTHVQFFTKRSLINLISKNGLKLIQFRPSNFMEGVFPYSLLAKRSNRLQSLDCWMADQLPDQMASGFMSAWQISK